MAITIATCKELGLPLAEDKTKGPSHKIAFLGIQLNATDMCTSLPPDKLAKLRTMLKELAGARVVRDKQLLKSLVKNLVHAATVFPLGKAFLNALFVEKQPSNRADTTPQPSGILRASLVGLLLEHWPGTLVHEFLQPDYHTSINASGS